VPILYIMEEYKANNTKGNEMNYQISYVENNGYKTMTAIVSEDNLESFCSDKIVLKIERIIA